MKSAGNVTQKAPHINAVEVAKKYARGVVNGDIVAGKLVIYACKRALEDWAAHGGWRGGQQYDATNPGPASRELYFDEDAAQKVVNFFGLLKHSKGEWGNKPFILEPWQVFVLVNLFGWKRFDGTRRFTEAYLEVARKNGKTTFLAGIGIYLLVMDGEPGAEIYSAATKKDQARILFDEAARMRKASSDLTKEIQAFGQKQVNALFVESTASKFLPLSSEDNTLDGLNIHGGLIDELHAHPDRKLYDVLYEATKARRQPLMIAITTAGYDRSATSICWNKRSHATSILEGTVSNLADGFAGDSIFAFVACLDEGDDPFDERNWPKANPNLQAGIVKIRGLRDAANTAKVDPTSLNSFLRKHMNVWTSQETKWMDPDKWALCNVAGRNSDPIKLRAAAIEALTGRKCFGGLDLSNKLDLTAAVLVFPPIDMSVDQRWHILGWYWVPGLAVPKRVKLDRVPYDIWIRMGFLNTTSGNAIDQEEIRERLRAIRKQFQIQEMGFDSWNDANMSVNLQGDGITMVECRQGYKTFSEPMKKTMALTLDAKFEHYGDPVLSWAMNNVAALTDPAGNIKPDKDKAKEKIDPAVATLMAMARALVNPITIENPYNNRGIIFI